MDKKVSIVIPAYNSEKYINLYQNDGQRYSGDIHEAIHE